MNSSATLEQQNKRSTDDRMSPEVASQRLQDIFAAACSSSKEQPDTELISQIVEVAAELTRALGVVFFERDQQDRLVIQSHNYHPPRLSHLRSLLQNMLRLANVAAAEESPQAGSSDAEGQLVFVAVPVKGNPNGTEAVAICMGVESSEQARSTVAFLTQVLTWIAANISAVRRVLQQSGQLGTTPRQEMPLFQQEKGSETDALPAVDPKIGYQELVRWIRDRTGCDEVVFGLPGEGMRTRCRIVAISESDQFDPRSDRMDALEEVMDETLLAFAIEPGFDANESAASPSEPREARTILATEALTKIQSQAGKFLLERYVLTGPDGSPSGVVLGLGDQTVTTRPLDKATQFALSQQLHWIKKSKKTWWRRLRGQAQHWHRVPAVWATLACLVLVMLLPMHLYISTGCVVQPSERRFVAVPYEGRLEEALTQPGDVVEAGQLLARMDARDVQWELSSIRADLRQAEKSRDTALADADTAASQIAGLEAQRLSLQIQELEDRLRNLEIRSPIAGVVVSGDPAKLEGSRFSLGDTLLEVAPLDEMRIELDIADEDIAHARVGQSVTCRLDAARLQTFEGTIAAIQPRAEMRENQNVFVGRIELVNVDGHLRPGMRGKARIESDRHALGWNLFRKPWEHLVSWIGW